MTDQHPITPPLELLTKLQNLDYDDATRLAYQAGADHELEACCKWFHDFYKGETWVMHDLGKFRSNRRPKPLSLKKQALLVLDDVCVIDSTHYNILLRALETLPDE